MAGIYCIVIARTIILRTLANKLDCICLQKSKAPATNGHISVDSDSDIDGHLANGYDSTDGYSSSDDDDEASVDVDRSKITGLSKVSTSRCPPCLHICSITST